MKKALSRDPVALYNLLVAKKKDLATAIKRAKRAGLDERVNTLTATMAGVDESLAKVVAKLNKLAEKELAAKQEPFQAQPAPSSRPKAAQLPMVAPEDEDESPEDPDEYLEQAEELQANNSGHGADFEDEAPAEEPPGEEVPEDAENVEAEPENPVSMPAKLRRGMGDLAADFLDEYAHALHKKVLDWFDTSARRALDMDGDGADPENSLRAILKREIGARGTSLVEPFFDEWRGALMKKLSKDIQLMFEPPPEEEPGLGLDPTLEPADEADLAQEAEGQEPEGEPVEQVDDAPEAAEEAEEPAQAEASAATIVMASGPVTAIVRDFKPSGFNTPKMD